MRAAHDGGEREASPRGDRGVTSSRRRVLRVIWLLAQGWYPTWILARETGLSQRAVQRIIRDMADIGFEVLVGKEDHTPEYHLAALGEA